MMALSQLAESEIVDQNGVAVSNLQPVFDRVDSLDQLNQYTHQGSEEMLGNDV
jgi:hypothetical protein